jgi:hypothetical protein
LPDGSGAGTLDGVTNRKPPRFGGSLKSHALCVLAGFLLATTGIGLAASPLSSGEDTITLHLGDRVVMPELRWECRYTTKRQGVSTPEFGCGRLGAPTLGITTSVELRYVWVRRRSKTGHKVPYLGTRP